MPSKRKEKNSLLLHYDYKEQFDELNDQQLRQLIYAMIEFDQNGTEIKLDPITKMAFIPIKKQLKKDKEIYEERCDTNKKNIEKRWQKNNTNVYDRIRHDTIYTDSEGDNDNDNDSECVINNTRDISTRRLDTILSTTPTHTPSLSELRSFCQENGMEEFDCEYFFNYYEANDWKNKNGVKIKNWQARVKNWYADDLKNGKIKQKKSDIDPDRVLEDENGRLYQQNYDGTRYYI